MKRFIFLVTTVFFLLSCLILAEDKSVHYDLLTKEQVKQYCKWAQNIYLDFCRADINLSCKDRKKFLLQKAVLEMRKGNDLKHRFIAVTYVEIAKNCYKICINPRRYDLGENWYMNCLKNTYKNFGIRNKGKLEP